MEPLVSVMMPAYNAGKTILFALASLQSQTYCNWECIVVDDGSTDNTSLLVDSLQDKRIHLIRFENNMGRGVARQHALVASQGEYLAMLDADDWIYPEKLAKQVQILASFPDVALVSTSMAIFDQHGKLVSVRRWQDDQPNIFNIPAIVPLPHAPSMFRASTVGDIQYDSKMKYSQDVDFLRHYLLGKKYFVLSDILYAYGEIESVGVKKMVLGTAYNIRGMGKFFWAYPKNVFQNMVISFIKMVCYMICGLFGLKKFILKHRSLTFSAEEFNSYNIAKNRIQNVYDSIFSLSNR